ncbi:DUF4132 domain-containing protein [Corynebacterium sp. A21]|uniref:DUF4132 domain-containing protein n=1 Tax=Corynebacterium sp. A21 TaxID=3457318 RepID=UPI003FCFBDD8
MSNLMRCAPISPSISRPAGTPCVTGSSLICRFRSLSWRRFLRDLLITDGQTTGLLRKADEDGLHLVDLDGESVEIAKTDSAMISIPHPVLIGDLAEWREFAVELG